MGKETVDRGAEKDGGWVTAGGYVEGCPRCEDPRGGVISFVSFGECG